MTETLADAMRRGFNRYIECRRSTHSEGNRHANDPDSLRRFGQCVTGGEICSTLAKELPDVHLELLNVQDPLPQKVHAVLSEQEVERWRAGEADLILQPARQILDAKDVQYQVSTRVGSPANEIARHAHETRCDAIIMGSRGLGAVANLMIGSVAKRLSIWSRFR